MLGYTLPSLPRFLWCKRLSPVTPARNVSPSAHLFLTRGWKWIKILHKSKKFRKLCCHLSQRWISLKQMMFSSYRARVTKLPDRMCSSNYYGPGLTARVLCMQTTHAQTQSAAASCYLDDTWNKLSFPVVWCAVFYRPFFFFFLREPFFIQISRWKFSV